MLDSAECDLCVCKKEKEWKKANADMVCYLYYHSHICVCQECILTIFFIETIIDVSVLKD